MCFHVNFAKFLRTHACQNTSGKLLLWLNVRSPHNDDAVFPILNSARWNENNITVKVIYALYSEILEQIRKLLNNQF